MAKKIKFKSPAELRKEKANTSTENTKYSGLQQELLNKVYNESEMEDLDSYHKNVTASGSSGEGCLTVINHERCGKRLHLDNGIWRGLGCPKYMKPRLCAGDLLISAGEHTDVAVKFDKTRDWKDAVENYKGKIVLYASNTSIRLCEEWGLDTDCRCCFTGGEYVIRELNGVKTAIISYPHDTEAEPEEEIDEQEEELDAEAESPDENDDSDWDEESEESSDED